jgi:GNAT superfamily N-acetyltransferase
MNNEIKKLGFADINETADLFVHCFEHDLYYSAFFFKGKKKTASFRRLVLNTVALCVEHGGAYGIFDGNILASFVLLFDYPKIKCENKAMFYSIFSGDPKSRVLPYKSELHGRIRELGENVTYLLSIGTHESYRRGRLASALVDFVLERYASDYIVGDVSNGKSLSIYRERGFEISDIDDGYFFVKRSPEHKLSGRDLEKDSILLLTADEGQLKEIFSDNSYHCERKMISGYSTRTINGSEVVVKSPFESCDLYMATLSYEQLLRYQRIINVCDYT